MPALTDLHLSVCHAKMARSTLPPPSLLAQARAACPRLRRFGFRALSEWQAVPKTLYNWLAADATDRSLACIQRDAVQEGEGVFVWEGLEWRVGGPAPGPGLASGGGSDAAAGAGGSGPGGSGATGGTGAAAGEAAADEAAVGIRTSSSSWLGSCLDAPAALDAATGALPGCRLESLVLDDPHHHGLVPLESAGSLSLRSLEALAGLRELTLRDIRRPPTVAREASSRRTPAADYLAQLLRLPSLTSLGLATSAPGWLNVLMPAHPAHGPQRPLPPGQRPEPEPPVAQRAARLLGPHLVASRLRHLRLRVRGEAPQRGRGLPLPPVDEGPADGAGAGIVADPALRLLPAFMPELQSLNLNVHGAASSAAVGAAPSPLLPRLHTLSAVACSLPPLAALLPAAGTSALTQLSLDACGILQPSGASHRASQLLLCADLSALAAVCGASLRVLRVTRPVGQLSLGDSAAAVRALCEVLPRLTRLQALCWDVGWELQDRLLGALVGLRGLRELALCGHVVGPEGQAHLGRLKELRVLALLCASRHVRRAKVAARQLQQHLPLCLIKVVSLD
ncbi:hypothetical protein GPECTOR_22g819 [Gonium pectorale]|uniref:Uncharacterized protein n=1 Tax=Gonium pectorale TaxID=33097 RepID=A0A150GHA8_GONPE|nr:hypothetical protein GPECTOR_22g819 [Gonium pectorale]|eukprot:KXZ49228.1 hypothetical protein GPECTOR_22g819 [Gonium pectorale]